MAARRLLRERGYQGAGVDAIARAAGITRQAIYLHHFATKTELLLALIEHVDRVEHVAELFTAASSAESGTDALGHLVDGASKLWPRVYDIASVLDSARATDPAAEIAWQDRAKVRRMGTDHVMRMLKRERQLQPQWTVTTATDLALDVLSPHSYDFLVRQCGWSLQQFAKRSRSVLFASLVVENKAANGFRASES